MSHRESPNREWRRGLARSGPCNQLISQQILESVNWEHINMPSSQIFYYILLTEEQSYLHWFSGWPCSRPSWRWAHRAWCRAAPPSCRPPWPASSAGGSLWSTRVAPWRSWARRRPACPGRRWWSWWRRWSSGWRPPPCCSLLSASICMNLGSWRFFRQKFCNAGPRTLCRPPPGRGRWRRDWGLPRAPPQPAGARVAWCRRGSTHQTGGLDWCRGDTWGTWCPDTRSGPACRRTSYICPRATCLRGWRSAPGGSTSVSLPPDRWLYT